jgi:PAS domain S-box-containing protein
MTREKHYLETELEQAIQSDISIWEFLRAGSLDGVWYWDLENPENEWMSPEFWRLFGIDPETKAHKASEWQNLIFPEDGELALKNFERHLADPSHPYDQVVRYIHADGSTVWVRCRGMAIRDKTGKAIRFLGAHVDLTSQVKAENAIADAKTFQDLMFQNLPDMVFVKDDAFRIIRANDKFLAVYPEDVRSGVIGTTTLEQYDDEEKDAFLIEDRRAFEEGFSEVEETISFPNGQRRSLLTRKVSFKDNKNQKFLIGIARDITELVQARSDNEKSLSLLETVLKTATSGVIGLNRDGSIAFINPAAREMLGGITTAPPMAWPEEIGFLDIETATPLDASNSPLQRTLAGQSIAGQVFLMSQLGDNPPRFVRVATSNVAEEKPDVRAVIILDDVSEQERNRQQVERASRLDALGQLTGGIAHDFNNLLATIQYNLQLAQLKLDKKGEAVADDYLDQALKSIVRGADLTERLLSFAKRQPGRATSQSVQEIFKDFEALSKPTIEATIDYQIVDVDEDLNVYCDPAQLENALLNLVLNSRDAIVRGGKGSTVRVQARGISEIDADLMTRKESPGTYIARGLHSEHAKSQELPDNVAYRYVEVAVTDDGPGMSDEVKARAIDPFFTTKGTNSGTGLGLSMVYGFIQQSGGELRIYSEEGHGTTVRLILPRGTSEGTREGVKRRKEVVPGSGQKILIVEDEPALLKSMIEIVEMLGYRAIGRKDAHEAQILLDSDELFDLLLTDIVMPGELNGFELASKARELRPGLPIVYMSGYTGYSENEMGDVRAELIAKPCAPNELSIVLHNALSPVR